MDVDVDDESIYSSEMDIDTDTNTEISSVFSTPPSSSSTIYSTPQSSSPSFSLAQSFADTPCPVRNVLAPLPQGLGDEMEGVIITPSKQTATSQAAASQAPKRNGVVSFNMQPLAVQPAAAEPASSQSPKSTGLSMFYVKPAAVQHTTVQPPASEAPKKNGVLAFSMQPATLPPTAAQPAQQPSQQSTTPHAPTTQPPKRNGAVSFHMQPAAQSGPSQHAKTQAPEKNGVLSFTMQPAAQPTSTQTATTQPPKQNGVVSFTMQPALAQSTPPQQHQAQPALAQVPDVQTTWTQSATQQLPTAQGHAGQATAPHPPAVPVVKDTPASADTWLTNDPAEVFKETWASMASKMPDLRAFEFASRRFKALDTANASDVAQLSSSNEEQQVPNAQSASSIPPLDSQPAGSDAPAAADLVQGFTYDDYMQIVLDKFASFHISEPKTCNGSNPSLFGPFMDRDKEDNFEAQLTVAANTQLPGGDHDGDLVEIKPIQVTQKAAGKLPTTELNTAAFVAPEADAQDKALLAQLAIAANTQLPGGDSDDDLNEAQNTAVTQSVDRFGPAEVNNVASVVPDSADREQRAEVVASQEKSVETQSVNQTDVSVPSTQPIAMVTSGSIQSHDSSEVMGMEGTQPSEMSKSATGQGQFDFQVQSFQFGHAAPYLFSQVNNPLVNAPIFEPSTAKKAQAPSAHKTPTIEVSEEQEYEVGSDQDPNVDLEYDFKRAFRPRKFTALVGASPGPAAPADATAATAATDAPQEQKDKGSSDEDLNVDRDYDLKKAFRPHKFFARVAASPGPARLLVPPVTGGFDISASTSQTEFVGQKRKRDEESDFEHDADDAHNNKTKLYGTRPERMQQRGFKCVTMKQLKLEGRTYNEEYGLEMMNEIFYHTFPRLVSQLQFPEGEWTKAEQEDEAEVFVESMLEEELNERSFQAVQEAFMPEFGTNFPKSRNTLFDVFSEWYVKFMHYELAFLCPNMNRKEIMNIGDALEDAFWKYMDEHPPKNDA